MLLDEQTNISKAFPMPTNDVSTSSSVVAVSGETVSLYYSNSGTRTTDAGQAAGTAVSGRLANKYVLDIDGAYIATNINTSLSFTGNCFTTEIPFPWKRAEKYRKNTWADKLAGITSGFANGEYCVDYENGLIYGVKATATTSLTSTAYSINQAQTGGSSTLPSAVDVTKIGSTAISAKNAAFAEAPLGVGMEFEALGALTTDGGTAGDKVPIKGSAVGTLYVTLADAAGAADIGASMNTLLGTIDADTGGILTATQLIDDAIFADDASFTLATSKVMVGGAYAEDPTSLTAVDAGDVTVLKTDLSGRLNTTLGTALSANEDSISTQPVEPSNYNTTAYAASGVIKAEAGTLYEIRGYSSAAAGQWIQVHDAAAVPADTAVPEDIVKVSADGNFYVSYPQGKSFGTGIVWSNSSTGPTKTIGAADCWVSAEYL